MDHKVVKKIVASVLCVTVAGSAVGTAFWAGRNSADTVEEKALAHVEQTVKKTNAGTLGTADKDETVYVLSGADGTTNKVIVSDWLHNSKGTDVLHDHSNLSNIENVKGEETFKKNKDGSLLWEANGNDIYYQGTTKEKPPVELRVTYTLDGKEISPEKLAGKSGRVTIRFDYDNTQVQNVTVKGQTHQVYVPFTVMTGMMLDTKRFSNVEVTNGKMENMGEEMAVVGLAFPGMQENLKISTSDLEIPTYVEVSADVEDFELETTMTLVTADLLKNLDTGKLDLGDLTSSANKLEDAMHQLMDGSDRLYNGLYTLLEQSQVLVAGLEQLSLGAQKLQGGAEALDGGVASLHDGAQQLYDGLTTLDSNSAKLNAGAEQIFDGLLQLATEQLKAAGIKVPALTRDNYADVITGIINSLDKDAIYQQALEKVTAKVNGHRDEIRAEVTKVVQEKVHAQVVQQVTMKVRETVTKMVHANEMKFRAGVVANALGMTLQEYNAGVEAGLVTKEQQDSVNAAVEAAMNAEIEKQVQQQLEQGTIDKMAKPITEEKMKSEEVQKLIDKNTDVQIEKAISEAMSSDEVLAQMQEAAEGAQKIISLKAMLDGYNSFYLGLVTYTGGVSTAAGGIETLLAGTEQLQNGSKQLADGAAQLRDGLKEAQEKSPALIDGVTQLKDGAKMLSDGLTQLMEEGIQKILDLADKDISGLGDRMTACVRAAEGYNTFTGINQDSVGAVKFIYKTDAIEAK